LLKKVSLDFFIAQLSNWSLRQLIVEVSRSHTPGKTPLNKRSACRRGRYVDNTQQIK